MSIGSTTEHGRGQDPSSKLRFLKKVDFDRELISLPAVIRHLNLNLLLNELLLGSPAVGF
jgi:hypothetical protein